MSHFKMKNRFRFDQKTYEVTKFEYVFEDSFALQTRFSS
jgi:hypothetical protein